MSPRLFGRRAKLGTDTIRDPGRDSGRDYPTDRDPAMDDLELRAAREQARAGDWQAARAVVVAAGTDWERRGHRLGALAAAATGDDSWLRAWVAASPDDPAAAALTAAAAAERAADARGGADAAHTSADQLNSFRRLMAEAETAAQRAIALGPADPAPWVEVLWSRFRDGDRDAFAAALAEGKRRDPHNLSLHHAALHFYCEKWYGSNKAMYELAREAAKAAPPGAGVAMLPVEAHAEYAMRRYCWSGKDGLDKAQAFFRAPEVQEELNFCVAKWRALGQPAHAAAMKVRHLEALAYALSGRRDDLKRVTDEIGPYLGDGYPWYYFYGQMPGGYVRNLRWANG